MRKCKTKVNRRLRLVVLFALIVMLAAEFPAVDLGNYFLIKNAEAVIGRPHPQAAWQGFVAARGEELAVEPYMEVVCTLCRAAVLVCLQPV